MEKRKYAFEGFASDLLEAYKDWFDSLAELTDFQDNEPQKILQDRLDEIDSGEESDGLLDDMDLFAAAVLSDKETFINYLEHYYSEAIELYSFMEERGGFGGRIKYFAPYNPIALSLCTKYFDSVEDEERAERSCFLLMCALIYNDEAQLDYFLTGDPTALEEISKDAVTLCGIFEDKLPKIEQFIYADWLAVHPRITWTIGKYYWLKEKYDEAREFFELGADLDYGGRQSIEPFIEVGKNQYELGWLYYKGLGVQVDAERALEFFEMAADNAGEPTIPVIQDMRREGLLPAESEDPILEDFIGYGDCNIYNTDMDVYYTKLNDQQLACLKTAADCVFEQVQDNDIKTLTFLQTVYQYRLYDEEKANEIESKIQAQGGQDGQGEEDDGSLC